MSFCFDTIDSIADNLLLRTEMMLIYPRYADWVKKCKNEKRKAIIAKDGNIIIGFIIIKFKNDSLKLCQIYVVKDYRNKGIGKKLLSLCEREAKRNNIYRMYVTVNKCNIFMVSFLENNEFYPIDIAIYNDYVYEKTILPLANKQFVLMALKPKYWKLILNGQKSIELRKVAWKNANSIIAVYVSNPVSKIEGLLTVDKIFTNPIETIQKEYLRSISITELELKEYLGKKQSATIIKIKRVSKLKEPIEIEKLSVCHPPQNYCYLSHNQFKQLLMLGEKEYERLY